MLWSVFGCSSTLVMSLGLLAVLLVTAAALLRYGSSHVSSLGSQKRNLFVSRESNTIATTNNFSSSVNASKDSDEKEWVGKFTPLADKKNQQTLQRQACVDNDSIALHVIFLVHGHKGLATDLKYLHTRIESLVASKDEKHFVLVHSSRCNEGKTDDGIQRGGERLAQEMHRFIHLQLQNMQPVPKEVTLSVVGNSLGGLYSRYAVAKLKDILQSEHQVTHLKDKLDAQANLNDMFIHKTPLFFNIFCTTASPHLGVADHTFFPIPRTAEVGMAYAMGITGLDLFRVNKLVKNMATSPYFLEALSLFRKRILYANAFSTDFVVPTGTAAILHHKSSSKHRFADDDDDDQLFYRENRMIIATLHTTSTNDQQMLQQSTDEGEEDEELVEMTHSLDALGWKKVFVDMRGEIPIGIPLPTIGLTTWMPNVLSIPRPSLLLRSGSSSASLDMDAMPTRTSSISVESSCNITTTATRTSSTTSRTVESKEIIKMFGVSKPGIGIKLPIAHNMIVAHTKPNSRLNSLNRRGQPVMDSLAQELVHEVLRWGEEGDK